MTRGELDKRQLADLADEGAESSKCVSQHHLWLVRLQEVKVKVKDPLHDEIVTILILELILLEVDRQVIIAVICLTGCCSYE